MTTPDQPYFVPDHAALVGELVQGNVLLYPWEWAGPDGDPQQWADSLERRCAAADVDVYFVYLKSKSVTVALNAAKPPTQERIVDGVRRIEFYRFMGRQMQSKQNVQVASQFVRKVVR